MSSATEESLSYTISGWIQKLSAFEISKFVIDQLTVTIAARLGALMMF